MGTETKKAPAKGIYLLPNLLTTAGLFMAFYAIVAAFKGQFETASRAIFIAMLLDLFDGRIARLTNTQSKFGEQFDSLADMVSFGVAPALIVYTWSLQYLGKVGWLAAFVFAAAGALRLARFNAMLAVADKKFFQGLSIPCGAATVISTVWLVHVLGWENTFMHILLAIIMVLVAALMVSNIKYYSFKEIDFKGHVPFVASLLVVLIIVGIALDPPLVLFIGFSIYAVSGPIYTAMRWRKAKERKTKK